MPTPCAVRKLTSFLSSKMFPPLSPFYSGYVMCNRAGCRFLSAQALCPPCLLAGRFHHGSPHSLRGSCSLKARGGYLTEVVNEVHLSSARWYFFNRAQDTWLREIQDRICQPCQSHKPLCLLRDSWEPCCQKKSISSQCLIVLHNDNILCCRELPSS